MEILLEHLDVISGGGFAVIVAILFLRFFFGFVKRQQKLIENHIAHNTEAMLKQVHSNDRLVEVFERHIEASNRLGDVVRDVVSVLKYTNHSNNR